MKILARNDRLGRTIRFSSTSLLWLAVAAPAFFVPTYAPPVLAEPSKGQKAPTSSNPPASNSPPETTTKTLEETGGTVLVYQVETNGAPPTDEVMEKMVAGITRRVQSAKSEAKPKAEGKLGQFLENFNRAAAASQIKVRRLGKDRVEVSVPSRDFSLLEQTKRRIAALGTLEFAILANRRDHEQLFDFDQAIRDPRKTVVVDQRVVADWREVASTIGRDGKEKPAAISNGEFDQIAIRPVAGGPAGREEILVIREPQEDRRITGALLKQVRLAYDHGGGPAIAFELTEAGGKLFHDLTTANKPSRDGFKRRLAILLDNRIVTAPSLRSAIGQSGIIEGNFTAGEVEETVAILNAGALPAPVKKTPLSEFTVVPRAGPKTAPVKESP